jgi:hypothetical protein
VGHNEGVTPLHSYSLQFCRKSLKKWF